MPESTKRIKPRQNREKSFIHRKNCFRREQFRRSLRHAVIILKLLGYAQPGEGQPGEFDSFRASETISDALKCDKQQQEIVSSTKDSIFLRKKKPKRGRWKEDGFRMSSSGAINQSTKNNFFTAPRLFATPFIRSPRAV